MSAAGSEVPGRRMWGYIGTASYTVSWDAESGVWLAFVSLTSRHHRRGSFDSAVDALDWAILQCGEVRS